MANAYGFQGYDAERMARALSTAAPVSSRHAEEIARWLCRRPVQEAKRLLAEVIAMERAVPFTRYNKGMGHRAGMAAGSYPIRASKAFLALLESAEANAQSRGLDAKSLVIAHLAANKGGRRFHGGRHGGRLMKRTHIEVVVAEADAAKPPVKGKTEKPRAHAGAPQPAKVAA